MPEIILPQRWNSQPQYSVDIDRGNSLTRGLIMAIIPGIGDVFSSNRSPTILGTGSVEPSHAGMAAISRGSTGQNHVEYPCNVNASGNRTLAVYATNIGSSNSINTHYINDADSADALKIGSTTFIGQIDNNSAASITITQSTTPRVYGARRASNQVSAFVDSTITGNSVTGTRALTGATSFRIGRDSTSSSIPSQTYLACYWDRALSDAEIVAFSRNPWQIFRPQTRRIFFDLGAGGGSTINATLGTATAIGYQASVSQDTNIAASLGSAVAEGFQATIATGTQIACAIGTAVAEGFQSAVATSTVIACALGTADATGYQAAVDAGGSTTIVCATGTADASGFTASVAQETVIACALGEATALGRTATVSVGGTGTGATVEEIWSYEIEPGVTAKVAMQRILAVLGGKVSGAGSGTETFRDINDTRDALVSVNDASGNRTSLTWTDGA